MSTFDLMGSMFSSQASRTQRMESWRTFQTKKVAAPASSIGVPVPEVAAPVPVKVAPIPVAKPTSSSGPVRLGHRPLGLKVPKHKAEQRH